jgi:feruloyl esterase
MTPSRFHLRWAALASVATLAACGGGGGGTPAPAPQTALACDDSLKTAFKPDTNTSVLMVKQFKKGDSLALSGTPAAPTPPTAANDVCMVKLLVGPGNQDTPSTAPSASPGIGIEVWLPTAANWNQRIHNLGGGGWAGGNQASTTLIGSTAAAAQAGAGYVSATTDTGHTVSNGSFAMLQNGGINSTLWEDFAERSLHQLALKTKGLTQGFYLQPQKFAYWDGCSTGGRQGYKEVQNNPGDYDGYLNGAPAFNWTKFITNELYPQIVMQQDLGAPMASAKINFVSAAAVSACDTVNGQHLGFILNPLTCRYDPTKDANVLCNGVQGNGGVVGTSTNAACVNLAEATAVNKFWYGQTSNGSVPDPAQDNAGTPTLQANQLWWGLTRGSNLTLLAGATSPFTISSDMVALELQDPTIATPSFTNATGNGANRWKQLTYADLANAYQQGIALQPFFGNINTDNADLSAAKAKGVKIITYHGLNDVLIPTMGSINYYTRVSAALGGNTVVNQFNRLFLIPGMGHCAGVGTVNGSASPAATANSVPLPATGQLFNAMTAWVESGTAPNSIVLNSADKSVSMPVCPYPQKATYTGSGSITAAASYTCQ